MKVLIDQNNLLVIENPNIPKLKKYDQIASGYKFCDYDKGIIVYHKKEIKIINLKNIGDNMNIFYITKRESMIENHLELEGFVAALGLFSGFDENTGNKYFFIPRMKESELENLNTTLEKLGIDIKLEKNEKGIVVKDGLELDNKSVVSIFANESKMLSILSFLFGLVLIYGKLDIKNGEIIGIKIHIPLFGQYIKYKESIDELIENIQSEGIFLNHSILQNGDGIIYQINSGDYELLGSFVNFYQSVEKVQKIFKQEFTEKAKSELINFIDINEQVPENGKEEVLRMIDDGIVKVLTVG